MKKRVQLRDHIFLWVLVFNLGLSGLTAPGGLPQFLTESQRRIRDFEGAKFITAQEREELTARLDSIITKSILEEKYKDINSLSQQGLIEPEAVIDEIGNLINKVRGLIKGVRIKDELSSLVTSDVGQIDILRSAAEFIFQFEKEMSLEEIKRVFLGHKEASRLLIRYFQARFDPRLNSAERLAQAGNLEEKIHTQLDSAGAGGKRVLGAALELFKATLKTDYFLEGRISLGLRIDPSKIGYFSDKTNFPEMPFGLIWVHIPYGAYGSHIRFQDVARGGVRELNNRRTELRKTVIQENFALALTQEYKNTDIPEGGAKGAFIAENGLNSVAVAIGYLDSLLNFMRSSESIVYYGDDLRYAADPIELGPDEGTDVIATVASVQAKMKGLEEWRVFMTAKLPILGGIPHKENNLLSPRVEGNRVTSQGVMIHLDETWKFIGKDPSKETVRINFTGGLDGDVGSGNIEIAIRKYGPNVKVISVTDASGTAYDKNGLDHGELLRLYQEQGRIDNFNPNKLGKTGFVIPASSHLIEMGPEILMDFNPKPLEFLKGQGVEILDRYGGRPTRVRIKGELLRDIIFFLAQADAFVPGGGLRNTINQDNVDLFFSPEGRPMAKAIVYGANVFTTPEANNTLEKKGVIVIPDEKANSVGVEVSSRAEVDGNFFFELNEMTGSIPAYFEKVLEKLKANAVKKNWALQLAKRKHPEEYLVTGLSCKISKEVVRLADIIQDNFGSLPKELVQAYLGRYYPDMPEVRARLEKIPEARRRATVSKFIAATIVYNAGFDYVSELRKSGGFSEIEIIKAYAQTALDFKLEEHKASVFARKYEWTVEEQIIKLQEIEGQQKRMVLDLLSRARR